MNFRHQSLNLLNRLGVFLPTEYSTRRFDYNRLLDDARHATGLHEFGDDGFSTGLIELLQSYLNNARLNFLGQLAMRNNLENLLTNRLLLHQKLSQYPEISDEIIARPIFILGLPRTGTTLLQNLLCLDGQHRSPKAWEVMYPCESTNAVSANVQDGRMRKASKQMQWMSWLAPGIDALHKIDAHLPQECIAITGLSFESYLFQTMCNVPDYQQWLETRDLCNSYRYHRFFLQQLQFGCSPRTWALKAPAHLFALEAINEIYPDARFIQLHRDPKEAIASTASLTFRLRQAFSDEVDPKAIGREIVKRWSKGLQQTLEIRKQLPELNARFIDLRYREFIRDPMEFLSYIYSHLNISCTSAAREKFTHYVAEHPKGRFGKHQYSMDQFGLDERDVEDVFSDYEPDRLVGI